LLEFLGTNNNILEGLVFTVARRWYLVNKKRI